MPVPIPLIALGAAYLATRAAPLSASGNDANMKVIPLPEWDPLIDELAPEIGDFLRRWITRESGGNPCSIGMWGGPWEAGLGQIYFAKEYQQGDKVRGVTMAELRVGCGDGSSQRLTRALTDEEKRPHVTSLVAEAREFIAKAITSAPEWSDEDQLCLAKLWHGLPAFASMAPGGFGSWDEFRAWMESLTRDEMTERNAGAGRFYSKLTDLMNNAQSVGRGY